MSTPTDPYNSSSKRPFDDEEILEPLGEETTSDLGGDEPVFEGEPFDGDVNIDGERIDSERSDVEHIDSENVDGEDFGGENTGESFERTEGSDYAEPAGDFRDEDLTDATPAHEEQASYEVERSDDSDFGTESNPTLGGYFRDEDDAADELAASDRDAADHTDALAADRDTDRDEMKIDYASAAEDETTGAPTRTSVMGAVEPADHLNTETAAATATAGTTAAASGFMATDETKREHWTTDPGEVEDIPEKPKGRFGDHFLGFLLTLLLVPVAWYLISDAGARLFLVNDAPWATEQRDNLAIVELVGGMVVLVLIALLARASSFGAQLWGIILMVAGFVAVILPSLGQQAISWLDGAIGDINPFTGNVVHHLNMDLGSGRIAVFGLVILLLGVVAHYARRAGGVRATAEARREILLKDTEK